MNGWVIIVTGLHEETREADLADLCEAPVHQLKFTGRTGSSRGYALVEFATKEDAQDCINKLHGRTFMGSVISVHWAFVEGEPTI